LVQTRRQPQPAEQLPACYLHRGCHYARFFLSKALGRYRCCVLAPRISYDHPNVPDLARFVVPKNCDRRRNLSVIPASGRLRDHRSERAFCAHVRDPNRESPDPARGNRKPLAYPAS
jgi:hypothetical protein